MNSVLVVRSVVDKTYSTHCFHLQLELYHCKEFMLFHHLLLEEKVIN